MLNMYIKIDKEGIIDVSSDRKGYGRIRLGAKYFLGNGEHVIFTKNGSDYAITRMKGNVEIYSYHFKRYGEYMITPLFVDTYKTTPEMVRSLYAYLKSNLSDKFYLEEDYNLQESHKIVFNTWIDRTFRYRYRVKVNPNLLTEEALQEIKTMLQRMNNVNLLNLHSYLNGKSIFVTERAIELIEQLQKETLSASRAV